MDRFVYWVKKHSIKIGHIVKAFLLLVDTIIHAGMDLRFVKLKNTINEYRKELIFD